jgi:hypothetical protein
MDYLVMVVLFQRHQVLLLQSIVSLVLSSDVPKLDEVLTRKFSIGFMAAGFVYLIGVILTFFLANLSHLTK